MAATTLEQKLASKRAASAQAAAADSLAGMAQGPHRTHFVPGSQKWHTPGRKVGKTASFHVQLLKLINFIPESVSVATLVWVFIVFWRFLTLNRSWAPSCRNRTACCKFEGKVQHVFPGEQFLHFISGCFSGLSAEHLPCPENQGRSLQPVDCPRDAEASPPVSQPATTSSCKIQSVKNLHSKYSLQRHTKTLYSKTTGIHKTIKCQNQRFAGTELRICATRWTQSHSPEAAHPPQKRAKRCKD